MLAPLTRERAPFQIAHVGPRDRRRIAHVHVVLAESRKLLQQAPPNLFLGEQHHDLIPLPNETEVHGTTEAQKYHRLAAECHQLAGILLDHRDDYLRMDAVYLTMAARSQF